DARGGAAVGVGGRGMRLLQGLLEPGGEPVAKSELMRSAWPGLVVEDSNLSVQVTALRKLLGAPSTDTAEWIVTVPRLGYRLHGAVAVEDTQLAPLAHGDLDHGGRPALSVPPLTPPGD